MKISKCSHNSLFSRIYKTLKANFFGDSVVEFYVEVRKVPFKRYKG